MSLQAIIVAVLFALAAAAGAVVRHLAGSRWNREFPVGTLVVNLVASAGLGVAVALPDPQAVVVGLGAIGALSTWSAAANEAAAMTREEGQGALAAGYLCLLVSSGVLMAWFGLRVGAALLG